MIQQIKAIRRRAQETRQWVEINERNREWLLTHPNRVDPEVRRAAMNWTEVSAAEMNREMQNARRQGRTSLRTRLKELVVAIIAHPAVSVKEATSDAERSTFSARV